MKRVTKRTDVGDVDHAWSRLLEQVHGDPLVCRKLERTLVWHLTTARRPNVSAKQPR